MALVVSLESLHARLKDLHENHRAVLLERNRIHNRLGSRLPLEIMSHIFTLCVSIDYDDCHSKTATFPIVCSVFHDWRQLALSIPGLWSTISVNACKTNLAYLNLWLLRSGSLPLIIRLYANGCFDEVIHHQTLDVMCLVEQISVMFYSFVFILQDLLLQVDCPSSAPLVEELHIHCWDGSKHAPFKLSTLLPCPQNLESLQCQSALHKSGSFDTGGRF